MPIIAKTVQMRHGGWGDNRDLVEGGRKGKVISKSENSANEGL